MGAGSSVPYTVWTVDVKDEEIQNMTMRAETGAKATIIVNGVGVKAASNIRSLVSGLEIVALDRALRRVSSGRPRDMPADLANLPLTSDEQDSAPMLRNCLTFEYHEASRTPKSGRDERQQACANAGIGPGRARGGSRRARRFAKGRVTAAIDPHTAPRATYGSGSEPPPLKTYGAAGHVRTSRRR